MGTFASTSRAAETVKAVQERYVSLQSLTARFTQISLRHTITGGQEEITQKGHLSVQKPGKLRWDYEKPERALYLSDGKTLTLYRAADKQVTVQAWDPDSLALQFLLGRGNLEKDFVVREPTDNERGEWKLGAGLWLHLTPKPVPNSQMEAISMMLLRVNAKSALIEEVVIADPIGTKTRWMFEDLAVNPKLSGDLFSFKAPKGTRVVSP